MSSKVWVGLWLILVCTAGIASAATFGPRRVPNEPSGEAISVRATSEAPASESQSYIQIDDMRFRVPAAGTPRLRSLFATNPWTDGVVYVEFAPGYPNDAKPDWFLGARQWVNVANLTFLPRTTEPNYIHVNYETSDYSEVGMVGGQQQMGLITTGAPMVIAHEIGHALGLWHEHQRSDRDSYVTILTANIQPDKLYNFNIVSGTSAIGAYDFDSIMHYSRNAFSSNGLNTIEPKPAYSEWLDKIGQLDHLSVLDGAGMAEVYGAPVPLPAPPSVEVHPGAQPGQVVVSWPKMSRASSYKVFYDEDLDSPPFDPYHNGTPPSGYDVGNTTTTTIADLTIKGSYVFAVQATNLAAESDYSTTVTARVAGYPDDAYEINDTMDEAYDLTGARGRWLSTLHGEGILNDSDCYKIEVAPGDMRVKIDCEGDFRFGDVYISLIDPRKLKVLASQQPPIDVTVTDTGVYYFFVSGNRLGIHYDARWDDGRRCGVEGQAWTKY